MRCWILKFELALLLALAPAAADAAKKRDKGANTKAAELAMRAVRQYRAGQYDEAAQLFMQAYEISARPAQLRNAAKAYEEGGMFDRSAELWTRYRDHDGVNRDEKAEADAHLKLILEKQKSEKIQRSADEARKAAEAARAAAEEAQRQAQEASQQASAAGATRIETPVERESNVGSYLLVGIGTVAAITGGALYLVSSSQVSDLDAKIAMVDGQGLIVGTSPGEVEDEVSGINTSRVISGVLLAGGAVALGTGLVWLLLDDGSSSTTAARSDGGWGSTGVTPTVAFTPAGANVGLVARF